MEGENLPSLVSGLGSSKFLRETNFEPNSGGGETKFVPILERPRERILEFAYFERE